MVTKYVIGSVDLPPCRHLRRRSERRAPRRCVKDGIPPQQIALMREGRVRNAGQSLEVRVPGRVRRDRRSIRRRPGRCLPRRASENLRLHLPATESGAGQFLASPLSGLIDRPACPAWGNPSRHRSQQPAGLFRLPISRHAVFTRASAAGGFQAPGTRDRRGIGSTTSCFRPGIDASIRTAF